jgi:lysophospholipid acyltransferase (LPLAT)-like uncharacterized protein
MFRSWDRFMLPKPFATITVRYAEVIQPAGGTALDGEQIVGEIDRALLRVSMPDER